MGYKILDVKADIKKDIRNYIDDNGYRYTSWENTLNFINNELS